VIGVNKLVGRGDDGFFPTNGMLGAMIQKKDVLQTKGWQKNQKKYLFNNSLCE